MGKTHFAVKHKDDEKNKPVLKMYVIENELRITLNKVLKWQYFILARNFYHFATTKLSHAYSHTLKLFTLAFLQPLARSQIHKIQLLLVEKQLFSRVSVRTQRLPSPPLPWRTLSRHKTDANDEANCRFCSAMRTLALWATCCLPSQHLLGLRPRDAFCTNIVFVYKE